jgi:hypothetical protein
VNRPRFDDEVVARAEHDLAIGVRAGSGDHRFTTVWSVTVSGRIYIRSWGLAQHSWFRSFRREPIGLAQIGGREYPVKAVRIRSESVLEAVDRAYERKYHTPASTKYVRDLQSDRSRATTTELIPPEESAT